MEPVRIEQNREVQQTKIIPQSEAQGIAKDDARLLAIRDWVEAEYEAGRTTAVSDDEMHAQYAKAFGGG